MSRTFSWRNRQQKRQPRWLLDRLSLGSKILLALVPVVLAGLTLWHTVGRDADQQGLDNARIVVDAATKLGSEDPVVVEPVVELLRDGGQPQAAKALDSVVHLLDRGRKRPKPVTVPSDLDSARAQYARLEQQVRAAPPMHPSMVDVRVPLPAGATLRTELVSIPAGASEATLPSGRTVSRTNLGTLWVGAASGDATGGASCIPGGCPEGMQCCMYVVDGP
jgi:hypothetical protein